MTSLRPPSPAAPARSISVGGPVTTLLVHWWGVNMVGASMAGKSLSNQTFTHTPSHVTMLCPHVIPPCSFLGIGVHSEQASH